jgi:hypothetical protein
MQVQSHSSNYSQTPRSAGNDRKSADGELKDEAAKSRRGDAITGSQAVLSQSLADALWAIQRSSTGEDSAVVTSVEDVYRAYAA